MRISDWSSDVCSSDLPDYDFEVICGARRHWSISWLRSHNYPDFRFLVDIRELSDEEAFRIADIENRAREDLSDLERARDYLRALDAYRSEEHTSELQSLMRISYAVFCLKKKKYIHK